MRLRSLSLLASAFLLLCLLTGAAFATQYNEAPQFAEMVAAGELPPVDERLPETPFVVEPIERIGHYGGTLRTASTVPEGMGDDAMLKSGFTSFTRPSPDDIIFEPHFAKEFSASDDMTVFTVHLRPGVKWSDGTPYTTDDIVFWYEHVLQNEDLTPTINPKWMTDGELMELGVIDEHKLQFIFSSPKPFFEESLFHDRFHIYPKHFLSQFHPDFVSEEELADAVSEAGFEAWYELFLQKAAMQYGSGAWDPDFPTIGPYVLERATSDRRSWVPNPYYWKVDTEGNQLPYVEGIDTDVVANLEVIQGMAISGQLDFVGLYTDIRNYPLYRQNEEEGHYRTLLWDRGYGSKVVYMFNLTHEDPALREIFQDVRFRRAMSLGIDRDEINETLYFGQGVPRQYTVMETSQYFEPEFATAYVEYDPEKANALLDEMGLDQRDSEGYRLRPDGERLMITLEGSTHQEVRLANAEMVVQQWQELDIDIRLDAISGELAGQRAPANQMDATLWGGDKATDVLFPVTPQFITPAQGPGWERTIWPLWETWFITDGREGEEPMEDARNLQLWWEEMMGEPDQERRIELGKKILASQAENLWSIGTIGEAPYPVLANKDLVNVPEFGLWTWDTMWLLIHDPEQIFIDR